MVRTGKRFSQKDLEAAQTSDVVVVVVVVVD